MSNRQTGTVDKFGHCWHFHLWHGKDDTDRQPDNDAYFQHTEKALAQNLLKPPQTHPFP